MAMLKATLIAAGRDDLAFIEPETPRRREIDVDSEKIAWMDDGPEVVAVAEVDGATVEGSIATTVMHLTGGDVLWVEQPRAYWTKVKVASATFGAGGQIRVDRGKL